SNSPPHLEEDRLAHSAPAKRPSETPDEHKPFVPEGMAMKEFTVGTVLLGLLMTVILGAANAYLGLKAGQTIAATYPAAVISTEILRFFRGDCILQEHVGGGGASG